LNHRTLFSQLNNPSQDKPVPGVIVEPNQFIGNHVLFRRVIHLRGGHGAGREPGIELELELDWTAEEYGPGHGSDRGREGGSKCMGGRHGRVHWRYGHGSQETFLKYEQDLMTARLLYQKL